VLWVPQAGDSGEVQLWLARAHPPDLTPPCRRSLNPINASMTVEVGIVASDRFGCRIAAVMNRPLIAKMTALVAECPRAPMPSRVAR
jgi:hypothetical protein